MTLVFFSLALGALLAKRYSVLALLPAALLVAFLGSICIPTPGGWSLFATIIAAVVSMQIGYLIGLACAHVLSSRKLSVYFDSASSRNSVR